jgi:hypothetical protein
MLWYTPVTFLMCYQLKVNLLRGILAHPLSYSMVRNPKKVSSASLDALSLLVSGHLCREVLASKPNMALGAYLLVLLLIKKDIYFTAQPPDKFIFQGMLLSIKYSVQP